MTIHSTIWEIFQETPGTLIDRAIFDENLDYFKYLFSQSMVPDPEIESLLERVCSTGNLDIIKFIVNELPKGYDITSGIISAINAGHINVLDYLLKNYTTNTNTQVSQDIITRVVSSNNTELIDCLKKYIF